MSTLSKRIIYKSVVTRYAGGWWEVRVVQATNVMSDNEREQESECVILDEAMIPRQSRWRQSGRYVLRPRHTAHSRDHVGRSVPEQAAGVRFSK